MRSFSTARSPFEQRAFTHSPSSTEELVPFSIIFDLWILFNSTDKIAEAHKSAVSHQEVGLVTHAWHRGTENKGTAG